MNRTNVALALLLPLALAGCGASSSTPAAAPAVSSPAPVAATSSPTPTVAAVPDLDKEACDKSELAITEVESVVSEMAGEGAGFATDRVDKATRLLKAAGDVSSVDLAPLVTGYAFEVALLRVLLISDTPDISDEQPKLAAAAKELRAACA